MTGFKYLKAIRPTSFGQDYSFLPSGPTDPTAFEIDEMIAWCTERFGPPDSKVGARWDTSTTTGRFFFRDENDALEFRMRW